MMSNEFYIKLGKDICKQIQNIREYAIEYNQLDEQWFINFLDELNKLSLDPDRKQYDS